MQCCLCKFRTRAKARPADGATPSEAKATAKARARARPERYWKINFRNVRIAHFCKFRNPGIPLLVDHVARGLGKTLEAPKPLYL